MTLGPAQRLEKFVPAMRTKGRLSPGMDADITVFDPGRFCICADLGASMLMRNNCDCACTAVLCNLMTAFAVQQP